MNTSPVPLPATVQFAPDYPIVTDRLLLRPFSRGDVDAVYSYRSRADVAEYLFDPPLTHDECAEAVRLRTGQVAFANKGDRIVMALERRSDGRLVGEQSLIWRSDVHRQAEIGYILHPDVWGEGLASEASEALLAFAFEVARIHRVYARCDVLNTHSAAVMRRIGMRQEAHLREHEWIKGRWSDTLIFAVLEDDWFAARRAKQ
jgi:RimJ/RimL family protein N-acetyltransferase